MSNLIDPELSVSWPNSLEMMENSPWSSHYGTSTGVEAPRKDKLAASCSPSMAAVQVGGLALKICPAEHKGG